jgi:hypothetical protein
MQINVADADLGIALAGRAFHLYGAGIKRGLR